MAVTKRHDVVGIVQPSLTNNCTTIDTGSICLYA